MSSDTRTQSRSAAPERNGRMVLVVFYNDTVIPCELPPEKPITLGRAENCELCIDHPSVSRQHARFYTGAAIAVVDLNSRNGTRVRGVPIGAKHPVTLQPGDTIECGDVLILLRALPSEGPTSELPAREALAAGNASIKELIVDRDGRWFVPTPNDTVNLGRRGAMRRLLLKLIEQRLAHPNVGLLVDELVAAGWPDEKMTYDSALARVYTTVTRLRALGLESVLLTRDDGYLLDPRCPVRWDEQESPEN